jgi:cysteinyl-tRNA synthetase
MHVGHINVNNEKMAKSLGNFILVKDLLAKYSGNDLR